MPATIPARWSPRPISSSCSNATCRGIRISTRRGRAARSRISARTRSIQRYPMRSFPERSLDQAGARPTRFEALHRRAGAAPQMTDARIDARRSPPTERSARRARTSSRRSARAARQDHAAISQPRHRRSVRHRRHDLQRISAAVEHCPREKPDTFFSLGPAGGLGWGFGAAIGAKLAAPEKLVVATLGDGSYMFGNPTVSHWVQHKFKLPILSIVFNNSRYGAVRRATLSMFKDGAAGENDGRFLADLDPSPPFDEFVTAQGGHGERVEKPADVPAALARARDAVRHGQAGAAQRHHAVLNRSTAKTVSHGGTLMRIDAFNHFFPKAYFDKLLASGACRYRQARARNSRHARSRDAPQDHRRVSRTTSR